MHIIESL